MSRSLASGPLSALSGLPEEIAVRLPQGQQLGAADAPVRLSLSKFTAEPTVSVSPPVTVMSTVWLVVFLVSRVPNRSAAAEMT